MQKLLDSGRVSSPHLFFFVRVVWATRVSTALLINFTISLMITIKIPSEIFIERTINLRIICRWYLVTESSNPETCGSSQLVKCSLISAVSDCLSGDGKQPQHLPAREENPKAFTIHCINYFTGFFQKPEIWLSSKEL